MRICIPITAENTESAIQKMNRCYPLAGDSELMLELRIDAIGEPDLETILSQKRTKVMVTNRRKEEGGRFTGTEEERVNILRQAVALNADYVDIEASTDGDLIRELKREILERNSGAGLVLSYHDFQSTPPESSLREKLEKCREWAPDIVKIATMAQTMEDNLNVLSLIPRARRQGQEIIAFCMGSAGRISRVMSPLLGAYLCFAAASRDEATAPGQMQVGDMLRVLGLLGSPPKKTGVERREWAGR